MTEDGLSNDAHEEKQACLSQADISDVQDLDIDQIVGSVNSSEPMQYYCHLAKFMQENSEEHSSNSVIRMLADIMLMTTPSEQECPQFVPFGRAVDKRTAQPSDFSGPSMCVIRECVKNTQNLVIKTRLQHLIWDIDRSDRKAGAEAVNGYLKILQEIESKKLSVTGTRGILSATSQDILCVLIKLSNCLGVPERKRKNIESSAKRIFKIACDSKEANSIIRFGYIFVSIDTMYVINAIEMFIKEHNDECDPVLADIWSLLAYGYKQMKDNSKYERCKISEAEIYIKLAEKCSQDENGSANFEAQFVEQAMNAYSGISASKTRFHELRQRLVDIERRIPNEMKSLNTPMNVEKLAKKTKRDFKKHDFNNSIMAFKNLRFSIDPKQLEKEAHKLVSEFPVHAMFPTVLKDCQGKTLARSEGATVGVDGPEGNFEPIISRNEHIRRFLCSRGIITPARISISQRHTVSKQKIFKIMRVCPTVPHRYRMTLADGFEKYFYGDIVAAVYMLVPMLEGILCQSLRWKEIGVFDPDVTVIGNYDEMNLSKIFGEKREDLNHIFGEAVVKDVERVFLLEWGPKLRHHILHALTDNNAPYQDDANYACWLVLKLCMFHITLQ